jgi:hypothetical protein
MCKKVKSPVLVEATVASTVAAGAERYQELFVGAVPATHIGERKAYKIHVLLGKVQPWNQQEKGPYLVTSVHRGLHSRL